MPGAVLGAVTRHRGAGGPGILPDSCERELGAATAETFLQGLSGSAFWAFECQGRRVGVGRTGVRPPWWLVAAEPQGLALLGSEG